MDAISWNDVEARSDGSGSVQDVTEALGAPGLRLHRAVLAPGAVLLLDSADERERVAVVEAGTAVARAGGAEAALGRGDAAAHLVGEPPCGIAPGPEGATLLLFAARQASSDELPDAVGLSSVHVRRPATAPGERPAGLRAVAAAAAPSRETGPGLDLGAPAGLERSRLALVEIAAGAVGRAPHWHSREDELIVVVAGSGRLELTPDGPGSRELAVGDVVSCPAGAGVAHTLRAGAGGMRVLVFGDARDDDRIHST